jgi:predicted MPP superfamily phosphohydrolase
MPILFILLLISYLLGNIYIFIRGLQALGDFSISVRGLYSAVYWICPLLLVLIFALRNTKLPFLIEHWMFLVGSGWLAFTLYMMIFLVCMDLIKVFNHSFSHGYPIALALTIILLLCGFVNYQHTRKQVINITVNKPLSDRDKLKIVAISDWHLGYGTSEKLFHKNIALINAEKPDLILIAGDLFDNSIVPVISQRMDEGLNQLEAPLGIYMVPGNHEYISGMQDCVDFLKKTKIQLLADSVVTLPCGLQIVGRDDHSNRKRLSANEWAALIHPAHPVILMDHQPLHLEDAQRMKVDLQFSGHTHHGQLIPLNWLTNRLFEISYGYRKQDDTHYYVSSGLALWGPPFRIGTNSEFVVFECSFTK